MNEELAEEDIQLFSNAWNKMHTSTNSIYIGYDSTNINTSAQGIEMAEYGHAKDNEELPQVNLSYAIDQNTATPLFYELYAGSINDNAQCKYMVEKAEDYGYKKIGFLLDTGYFSKSNILEFDKNGYEFILMVKENAEMVSTVIEGVRAKLRGMSGCFLAEHNICGTSVKEKLYVDDKKERFYHVYYDDVKASARRIATMKSYDMLEKELEKKVDSKLSVEGELKKYKKAFRLKYDENGYLINYQRRDEYIRKQLDGIGYFVIITSEEMDAGRALDIYRDRDNIEKLFRNLKTELGYSKFGYIAKHH